MWDRIKAGLPRVLRRDLNVQLNQDLINMCYTLSRAQTGELRCTHAHKHRHTDIHTVLYAEMHAIILLYIYICMYIYCRAPKFFV